MYLLGYDIGSSSVKATLVKVATGESVAGAFQPKVEMPIQAPRPGWAEQDPEMWWKNLVLATREVLSLSGVAAEQVIAIGISYQMHGLVCTDKNNEVLRPAIIWCDSRAVNIGKKAFTGIGEEKCLQHLLNSPGNFTASRLRWVKENEPALFDRIHRIMLPGDYIAFRLTGELCTTISGLSEGILWDFKNRRPADLLMEHFGFTADMLPELKETFSEQGRLHSRSALELGLTVGTPVCYRAGDQPNNAFSLNVLEPGEIAATAGTSGVVYGISDLIRFDPLSRINTFAHVNHSLKDTRLGVLLCINGTGILNSWVKRNTGFAGVSYQEMDSAASVIGTGSDGLAILPFGNGSERMLRNANPGCVIAGVDFNRHNQAHLAHAAQEGIAFAFHYGLQIMKHTGIRPSVIRAGDTNMFLSTLFRETLANTTGATIELYNTDGSQGAAKGAGIGAHIYRSFDECFASLRRTKVVEPDPSKAEECRNAYAKWMTLLDKVIHNPRQINH